MTNQVSINLSKDDIEVLLNSLEAQLVTVSVQISSNRATDKTKHEYINLKKMIAQLQAYSEISDLESSVVTREPVEEPPVSRPRPNFNQQVNRQETPVSRNNYDGNFQNDNNEPQPSNEPGIKENIRFLEKSSNS